MKCPVKAKVVRPLMEVARRYSVNAEFVTFTAAYAVWYVSLNGSVREIAVNLEADPATTAAAAKYTEMYRHWLDDFDDQAHQVKTGVNPKKLIHVWAGRLLKNAQGCGTLVDAYDVYEILMNYWSETMQDDCYLVSRDGWKAELLPPAKKNATWESYVCDLLPVEVVANVCFKKERDGIAQQRTELGAEVAGHLVAMGIEME